MSADGAAVADVPVAAAPEVGFSGLACASCAVCLQAVMENMDVSTRSKVSWIFKIASLAPEGAFSDYQSSSGTKPKCPRIQLLTNGSKTVPCKKYCFEGSASLDPHRPPGRFHLTRMPQPMLVFDGDCGFCHRAVQFILAHERRSDLLFIPRNSARGLLLRDRYHLQNVESLLWIEEDRAFIEWKAVLHTALYVGGIYAGLARVANLLPATMLNRAYRLIARIRKRLAGPPRHCLLLSPAQQQRFLG